MPWESFSSRYLFQEYKKFITPFLLFYYGFTYEKILADKQNNLPTTSWRLSKIKLGFCSVRSPLQSRYEWCYERTSKVGRSTNEATNETPLVAFHRRTIHIKTYVLLLDTYTLYWIGMVSKVQKLGESEFYGNFCDL